ncbi:MAG: hypothetical protein IJR85_11425 [Synergistaceae bacterium]|nr:hypothetical protein [Synergistaceae bacterium]
MPHITAIGYSESQRRQLSEKLSDLAKKGWPLSGKYEAQTFPSWQDLFSTVIQPGLFAEREAFVIEGAESLGAFPEKLSSIIEDDKADTQIILVFSGDTKTLKSIAESITIIKPEAQVPFWKRQEWLMNLAKSAKIKIGAEAVQLLCDSIESQEELRNELSKLAFYTEGREIVRADVEALSFDEGGRSLVMFLDGICDRKPGDVARAMKYLRGDSILPALSAIVNRLRPALILAAFPKSVQEEALKVTDNDPARNKHAFGKASNALKNYGAEDIKRFILGAIRLSFLEKTGRAEGWEGFETIIWELMMKL